MGVIIDEVETSVVSAAETPRKQEGELTDEPGNNVARQLKRLLKDQMRRAERLEAD